jgi:hypothetical protein
VALRSISIFNIRIEAAVASLRSRSCFAVLNLRSLITHTVFRIVIKNGVARGVVYSRYGMEGSVFASKEVILSAG